jgi:hypothetical protein
MLQRVWQQPRGQASRLEFGVVVGSLELQGKVLPLFPGINNVSLWEFEGRNV